MSEERRLFEDELETPMTTWNRQAPYGICPACGTKGFMECPSEESDIELFVCTKNCHTIWRLRGGGTRPMPTRWWDKKPPEMMPGDKK